MAPAAACATAACGRRAELRSASSSRTGTRGLRPPSTPHSLPSCRGRRPLLWDPGPAAPLCVALCPPSSQVQVRRSRVQGPQPRTLGAPPPPTLCLLYSSWPLLGGALPSTVSSAAPPPSSEHLDCPGDGTGRPSSFWGWGEGRGGPRSVGGGLGLGSPIGFRGSTAPASPATRPHGLQRHLEWPQSTGPTVSLPPEALTAS